MAGGLVNIILRAVSKGSGFADNIDGAKKLQKEMGGLSNAAKVVGLAFGSLGGMIGSFFQKVLTGGIWEAGAHLFRAIWTAHTDAQAKAAEEAKRLSDEMVEANGKLIASIKEASAAQSASIDRNLSRREKEIDKVKELTKAEIELARQRKIAAAKGDEATISAANKQADMQLAEVDAEAAAKKIMERMESAEEKVKHLQAAEDMAGYAWEQAEAENQRRQREYQRKADEAAQRAMASEVYYGPNGIVVQASQSRKERAAARAREEFAKSKEGRELQERISSHADRELKDAKKTWDDAKEAVKKAEEARQDAADSAALFIKNREVAGVKAANAEASAVKKAADERQKAEIAAAQAAAKERERLDREAHQKRMEDLRKEIAAQKSAAAVLTSRASAAQSEFDKAFAMYRDPSRAAAEIGEEKDYQNDLDRLHRDARRYGGKWRIDELSRLMSAGDTQGVTDTLKDWRKSRNFTPGVEAMVRASAAENAKTSTLDELRKIETNTAGLDKKLDELLSMKGGS